MKLDEYSPGNVNQEMQDFMDDVRAILNYGKYQFNVVSAIPDWAGKQGESALFVAGGTSALYVMSATSGTTWEKLA